MFGVMTWCDL